jgi:hypothetical protein
MKVGKKACFNVWQVNRTDGDLIPGTLWPPGLPEQVPIQILFFLIFDLVGEDYSYKQD